MWSVLAVVLSFVYFSVACKSSTTRVSGTHAPSRVCGGQLIFSDDFNNFDLEIWQHEIYLSQIEFQYYSNNRSNSFAHKGSLFIKPTLTSDHYDLNFITNGTLDVNGGVNPNDRCTYAIKNACEHNATATNIINPVKSASIRTVNSLRFRYGRVEIRAKLPSGDWLKPLFQLMPAYNEYGSWPASGEITILESSGNKNLTFYENAIGTQEIKSLLDFGPFASTNAWNNTFWIARNTEGYSNKFHRYQLEWTPAFIAFLIDDWEVGRVTIGDGGFWALGGFSELPNVTNPWRTGSKMAPFDKEFYIALSLGVGGVSGFFPDGAINYPHPKPWRDTTSNTAPRDFWRNRARWLSTWNLTIDEGKNASLQIDYVRVWAL